MWDLRWTKVSTHEQETDWIQYFYWEKWREYTLRKISRKGTIILKWILHEQVVRVWIDLVDYETQWWNHLKSNLTFWFQNVWRILDHCELNLHINFRLTLVLQRPKVFDKSWSTWRGVKVCTAQASNELTFKVATKLRHIHW